MNAPTAVTGQTHTVERTIGDVVAYRQATRAPLATPAVGDLASPLYPFALSHELFDHTVTALAADGAPVRPVHLSQEIIVSRLVRSGDVVRVVVDLLGARREARGVRLALRSALSGGDGDPVAELLTTVLMSGATAPDSFGEIPNRPAPAAPDGPTDEVTIEHVLTVDSIRGYAEASGDHNPIHLDADAGRAAGFPGVIAHGVSVLALVCEEVVDRYAGGDPARVGALGCRFSAPVLPDEPIRTTLRHSAGAVRFSCATDRGLALKSGWVDLDPARGDQS